MIVGIGTDVVSIDRIAGVLERHGERFVNRVLTPDERARFHRTQARARARLAIASPCFIDYLGIDHFSSKSPRHHRSSHPTAA